MKHKRTTLTAIATETNCGKMERKTNQNKKKYKNFGKNVKANSNTI